jgi:dimethylargininase
VPPSINECELTHLAREPIDYARAVEQHAHYERCLRDLGCEVEHLPAAADLPDSVFVEDAAVVFDDLAVIARPGAPSRRGELDAVADALRRRRALVSIEAPGTLDGGDVLVAGDRLFVGISGRTNAEGARQLGAHLAPFGFSVQPIAVDGCLHLKSAVTVAGEGLLLINPAWVDPRHFAAFDLIEIDPAEPFAANVLRVGDTVVCAAAYPRTRDRLAVRGVHTIGIDADELAKAEGGLTCCSLLIRWG